MSFEIGQKVLCVDVGSNNMLTLGKEYTVSCAGAVLGHLFVEVTNDKGKFCKYYPQRFAAAPLPTIDASLLPARSNDPATSKAAAKAIKPKRVPMRETILDLLERYTAGLTGQEIAERTGFRLNSVTPRFAELTRGHAPRIKDSGLRRSGQIVWVLADCKVPA